MDKTFKEFLALEAARNAAWHRDAEFDMEPDQNNPSHLSDNQAPFFVYWSGQSREWYGDGSPSEGKGRYKMKGNGGSVVAINVPNIAAAQKIADDLNASYKNNTFPDRTVYGKSGEDMYIVDYDGAFVLPMQDMDPYDLEMLPIRRRQGKIKDYSR